MRLVVCDRLSIYAHAIYTHPMAIETVMHGNLRTFSIGLFRFVKLQTVEAAREDHGLHVQPPRYTWDDVRRKHNRGMLP